MPAVNPVRRTDSSDRCSPKSRIKRLFSPQTQVIALVMGICIFLWRDFTFSHLFSDLDCSQVVFSVEPIRKTSAARAGEQAHLAVAGPTVQELQHLPRLGAGEPCLLVH